MTKLLVATGRGPNGVSKRSVEVVNLDQSRPNMTCENLPDFPLQLETATGQLFRGTTPILCGGSNGVLYKNCFALENGNWNPIASLSEGKYGLGSGALTLPNTSEEIMLVFGGFSSSGLLATVESFDGVTWNGDGIADMAEPVWLHCVVKINSTTLFSIGGFSSLGRTDETWFYNIDRNEWYAGPKLNTSRDSHSCEKITWQNASTGQYEDVVIVAGGFYDDIRYLNSVKFLFLNDPNAGWTVGPDMPWVAYGQTMVEYQVLISHGKCSDKL